MFIHLFKFGWVSCVKWQHPVTITAEKISDAWEQLEQAGNPQLSAPSTQINIALALSL